MSTLIIYPQVRRCTLTLTGTRQYSLSSSTTIYRRTLVVNPYRPGDDIELEASETENPMIGTRVIYLPDGNKRYRIFKNGAKLIKGRDYTRETGQDYVTLTDNQGDIAEDDTYSLCEY